jgi:phosphoglycerate dehydrogenase-like enzyme
MARGRGRGPLAGGSTRPLAVFTDPGELDPSPGTELLEANGFEVAVLGSRERDRIVEAARGADALVIGYATVDRQLLDELRRVRIVSTMSVGVDSVDLAAATERGIWVTNVPDAATEEVAVHALALALDVVRRLTFLDRHVRSGGWALDAVEEMRRPSALTFGVVGLGRIGSRVAALAKPIFGRVLGHDPFLDEASRPDIEVAGSLDVLLEQSDVVSLHLPAQAGHEALLDERRLGLLPRGAGVVNVSRGSLLDTRALVAALNDGRLSAAGLDVADVEPPGAGHPVRRHPRIVATPHLAYLSDESARQYPLKAAENVLMWARTGSPRDVIVKGRTDST